jgi:UDP-galactopyranose mutase
MSNAAQDDEPNVTDKEALPRQTEASRPIPRRLHASRQESVKFPIPRPFDLVCISQLRWNFVVQRPQHLMTRFARDRRVFFIEEPEYKSLQQNMMRIQAIDGIILVTPQLVAGDHARATEDRVRYLLNDLMRNYEIWDYVLWYYTPMALTFTRHLTPRLIVWDCMDELSAFDFAPIELADREAELLRRVHVVFTGGISLYEAKCRKHHNVHAFPSSIDVDHFLQARSTQKDPDDQHSLPHPRIGFFGVIDERFDSELLRSCAELRPDWHWVIIGPVVKIDPLKLPKLSNIHYLGKKHYSQLPAYLSGWNAAILPFAHNESTRYISPTKIPEYLAAGRPVVSTSIRDVMRPYGDLGLVHIADNAPEFIAKLQTAMNLGGDTWLAQVDQHLKGNSWDRTCQRMLALIHASMVIRDSGIQVHESMPMQGTMR